MEFITDLPLSGLFKGVFTVMNKMIKWVKLLPMVVGEVERFTLTVAHLFFDYVVHSFGVLHLVLHDRETSFNS